MRRKFISLFLSLVAAVPFGAALTVTSQTGNASAAADTAAKKATPAKAKVKKTPVHKKSTKKKTTKKHKKHRTTKKKKTVTKATPTPRPTSTPRPTTTPTSAASGTFAGPQIQSRYGPIQVSLVVENGQITDVKVSNTPDTARSVVIQDQAVPLLKQEVLKAQSAGIHMISGATVTSRAFEQSLQSALTKAAL